MFTLFASRITGPKQRKHSGPLGQRRRSSNSRQRSSSENVVHRSIIVTGGTPMDAASKKRELSKVPTRKLLASLKLDIRRQMRTSAASASAPKPKKKK